METREGVFDYFRLPSCSRCRKKDVACAWGWGLIECVVECSRGIKYCLEAQSFTEIFGPIAVGS